MDFGTLAAVAWALGSGFGVGLLVLGRARRRYAAALAESERRAAKEAERARIAELDLAEERRVAIPLAHAHRSLVEGLTTGAREIAATSQRREVALALARAVETALAPRQYMVFLAADGGREFVRAAGGGEEDADWEEGSRLDESTGRIGLAVRRRATVDHRDWAAEPLAVREHVQRTEPEGFRVEFAVPVVVGDEAVAVVSVGGSRLDADLTRAGLELLAAHACSRSEASARNHPFAPRPVSPSVVMRRSIRSAAAARQGASGSRPA